MLLVSSYYICSVSGAETYRAEGMACIVRCFFLALFTGLEARGLGSKGARLVGACWGGSGVRGGDGRGGSGVGGGDGRGGSEVGSLVPRPHPAT